MQEVRDGVTRSGLFFVWALKITMGLRDIKFHFSTEFFLYYYDDDLWVIAGDIYLT